MNNQPMFEERCRGHRYAGASFDKTYERHWVEWVIVAAAVLSAAASTYAAVQQSEQNAAMARATRKQRETEAAQAADAAMFEERQHRRRIAILLGKQQAIFAASGVDPSSGSPLVQQIDLIKQGEIEALNIRAGGSLESSERMFEAGLAKYRARTLKSQVPLQIASGVTSAVAGAGVAYSRYQTRRKTVGNTWIGPGQ